MRRGIARNRHILTKLAELERRLERQVTLTKDHHYRRNR
jgi:hypothetical protein